jgi:hypothetical protein
MARPTASTVAGALGVLVLTALTAVVVTHRSAHSAGAVGDPSDPASVAATSTAATVPAPRSSAAASPLPAPWTDALAAGTLAHLRAGSNPAVLPADLLIADKLNNRLVVVDPQGRVRWQFPRPGDLAAGQTFLIPDDAFFTPDGRQIVATQEDDQVISIIDVATHRIVYRYGVPGHPGATDNHVDNPDDALVLPDGTLLSADIKNCRMILVAPGAHRPSHVIGQTRNDCLHAPPARWGSPNGVFPMTDGHYLVTEINGDWVDDISLSGRVYWSVHPPGVAYPSDSNQIGPDRYLTVDYSAAGQVVIFDHTGRLLWRYSGSGVDRLDHPSLALPLPNGDIALNDDYKHRVLVIDPRSNRIVWQYGVTGVPGSGPGYLDNPDGIDLVPPQSFLVTHSSTIGLWPN